MIRLFFARTKLRINFEKFLDIIFFSEKIWTAFQYSITILNIKLIVYMTYTIYIFLVLAVKENIETWPSKCEYLNIRIPANILFKKLGRARKYEYENTICRTLNFSMCVEEDSIMIENFIKFRKRNLFL